jgi:hypothetical protein
MAVDPNQPGGDARGNRILQCLATDYKETLVYIETYLKILASQPPGSEPTYLNEDLHTALDQVRNAVDHLVRAIIASTDALALSECDMAAWHFAMANMSLLIELTHYVDLAIARATSQFVSDSLCDDFESSLSDQHTKVTDEIIELMGELANLKQPPRVPTNAEMQRTHEVVKSQRGILNDYFRIYDYLSGLPGSDNTVH